jgi:ferric-dicitrate binding protein FerR (iron transport regulator)
VQTKDVTVSVVGTVFLVNAEEAGSRVAVIEGEVRVQQRGAEKKLVSGEQPTTSVEMPAALVRQRISSPPGLGGVAATQKNIAKHP